MNSNNFLLWLFIFRLYLKKKRTARYNRQKSIRVSILKICNLQWDLYQIVRRSDFTLYLYVNIWINLLRTYVFISHIRRSSDREALDRHIRITSDKDAREEEKKIDWANRIQSVINLWNYSIEKWTCY